MVEREITTIFDITEDDVDSIHETLVLVRALEAYTEDRAEHKRSFDPQTLAEAERYLDMLWQSMAVVVASKQDREISPEDLMGDVYDK